MENNLPTLIVVGSPAFADILEKCGAQWKILEVSYTINEMWARFGEGKYPSKIDAILITDGTASKDSPEDLPVALAFFASKATTFFAARQADGDGIIQQAEALFNTSEDFQNPNNAPIHFLASENLTQGLTTMRNALQGKVIWPVVKVVTPEGSEQRPTPELPSAPISPPVAQRQPTPVAPPASSVGYAQESIYSPQVAEQASKHVAKKSDAKKGQVTIACMSSKGGSGKSTTAICLAGTIAKASAAAGEPKKVVIVDLDTRDGQLGSLIGQYLPTAISLRVMPKIDAPTVLANLVHDTKLGIDALLAPIRPRNAADVTPDFYRQVIQVLQTTHDVVILDCSVNYLDPLLGVGFALSDEILFITTVATTSVEGMARSLTELFAPPEQGGLGIPRSKIGIVANSVINNVGMGKDKLLRAALGAPMVGQIPAEYDVVLRATNETRMGDLLKNPRLGPAYFQLAKTCLPNFKLAELIAVEPEEKRRK